MPSTPDDRARAVLWDLDGTLADSAERHFHAWQDALAARQRPLTRAQFQAAFGQRNASFLRAWLGPDLSAAEVQRVGDEKEAEYRRRIEADGLDALPGAVRWTRRLAADGWRQAVASSAPRANVVTMLRALGIADAFHALVGAEDVSEGKPSPQVFLAAAAQLGVAPSRCIVVEDAAVGIEAARRAGMRSIGVSHLETLPADVAVASLDDLAEGVFDRLVPLRAGSSVPDRRG